MLFCFVVLYYFEMGCDVCCRFVLPHAFFFLCMCFFLWYLFHVGFCVVFWVVVDYFGWVGCFVLCCVVLSCVVLSCDVL